MKRPPKDTAPDTSGALAYKAALRKLPSRALKPYKGCLRMFTRGAGLDKESAFCWRKRAGVIDAGGGAWLRAAGAAALDQGLFSVVGLGFHSSTAAVGQRVELVREPSNKHDKNAIKVVGQDGKQAGYIARDEAAALSTILDAGIRAQSTLQVKLRREAQVKVCFELPCGGGTWRHDTEVGARGADAAEAAQPQPA